jgi:hypothetical protein
MQQLLQSCLRVVLPCAASAAVAAATAVGRLQLTHLLQLLRPSPLLHPAVTLCRDFLPLQMMHPTPAPVYRVAHLAVAMHHLLLLLLLRAPAVHRLQSQQQLRHALDAAAPLQRHHQHQLGHQCHLLKHLPALLPMLLLLLG